jgi:hypothetical protein
VRQSYWHEILSRRASRRSVVIGGASLAGATALLAACGGSDDAGSGGASTDLKIWTDTKAETPVKMGGHIREVDLC